MMSPPLNQPTLTNRPTHPPAALLGRTGGKKVDYASLSKDDDDEDDEDDEDAVPGAEAEEGEGGDDDDEDEEEETNE